MKYYGIIILLIIICCNTEGDDFECHSNGENFISTSINCVDSCHDRLIIYDKISEEFYYSFLIGPDTLYIDDFDVSKCKASGEYIRLIIKADSLRYDNILAITGTYELIDTDLNEFCYRNSEGNLVTDKITGGTVKLLSECPYYHLLRLEFEGQTLTVPKIFAASYIQTPYYSYKLVRTVEGQFVHRDTIFELSMFNRYDGFDQETRLRLLDHDGNKASELLFDIRTKSDNLTGRYTCNNSSENSFAGYFWIEDHKYDYTRNDHFIDGELNIVQDNFSYTIDFDLLTQDSVNITGYWEGEVYRSSTNTI